MEIGIPLRTPDGTFAGRCNRASKSWGSTATDLWLPVPDHTEFILVLCKTLKPTHDEFKGVALVSVMVSVIVRSCVPGERGAWSSSSCEHASNVSCGARSHAM